MPVVRSRPPFILLALVVAAFTLLGCGSQDGEPLMETQQADTEDCEHGGTVITTGVDRSGDGQLADDEITDEVVVCDGQPGDDGDDGDQGPTGPEGPPGEAGDDGICADAEPLELEASLEEMPLYRVDWTYELAVEAAAEDFDVEIFGDLILEETTDTDDDVDAEITFTDSGFSQLIVAASDGCTLDTFSIELDIYPPTYKQLDGGPMHTCGVRTDGTIECWGTSHPNPVNFSDDFDMTTIFDVPDDDDFVDVDVDMGTACGLHEDGTVSCWGNWLDGSSLPDFSEIELEHDIVSVNTSGSAICLADREGTAMCTTWEGTDLMFDTSELFDGDDDRDIVSAGLLQFMGTQFFAVVLDTDEVYFIDDIEELDPVAALEGEQFEPTDMSWGTFCGSNADDELQCESTVLDTDGDDDPTTLAFASDQSGVERLDAGITHGCAVLEDGSIDCIGEVSDNVADDPDDLDETALDAPEDETFTHVAAGALHSCGLTEAGEVICWGDVQIPSGSYPEVTQPIQ